MASASPSRTQLALTAGRRTQVHGPIVAAGVTPRRCVNAAARRSQLRCSGGGRRTDRSAAHGWRVEAGRAGQALVRRRRRPQAGMAHADDVQQRWKVRSAQATDGWAVHHLLHVVFRGRDTEKESQGAASEPPSALDDLGPVVQALLLPAQLLKRTSFYLSSKAMYFVRLLSFVVYAVPHWVLVVEPAATGVRGIVGSCDLTLMPPSATVPVMEALRAADCMPRDRQVLYLSNMAVAPRARRSGVASSLLRAAIAHADALQTVGLIALFVLPDNHGAIRLYELLGWRPLTTVPTSNPPGQLLLVRHHPNP